MELPLLIVARALHIGSALLLVALFFFRLAILRGESPPLLERPWSKWPAATFAVQMASGIAWLGIATAEMSDSSLLGLLRPAPWFIVLQETNFGHLWIFRFGVAVLLGISLVLGRRSTKAFFIRLIGGPGSFFLSIILLLSLAWAGHAAADVRAPVLHLGIDLTHLALAAIWPAGLVPLAIFLHHIKKSGDIEETTLVFSVLHRFSQTSITAVSLLFITGVAHSWLMIPHLVNLATSAYGELLLGKVALFFITVGLGARNRTDLMRRHAGANPNLKELRQRVLIENGLGLAIILVVGAMGAISPPP